MKKLLTGSAILMLACSMLFLAGCERQGSGGGGGQGRAQGRTFTLNMSTQLADSNVMVDGFRAWADAVRARTDGRVQIQIFPSAQLGSDEDVIEQALQGVNVAVLTDGGRMANYAREIGVIGMPYLVDNYEELRKITETQTFQGFDAELRRAGIRILSYNWYDGPRNFYTNRRVSTPSDLQGLRIRTPGAPVWSRSVAALGATPIAMGWNDAYSALQNRVIDGVEVQSTSALPSRIYEVTSFMARTEHFHLANFIMVGERWFNTLPAEYQQILIEECVKASIENAQRILETAADFERQMAARGMTISDVNKALFITAAEAAYNELGFTELRNRLWSEIGKR